MGKIKKSLKLIDYRLFFIIFVMGLIPTIYTTVRLFFIGNMASEWSYHIVSQLTWLKLLYEVVQETMILPLFYFIGKALVDKKELVNRLRSSLVVTMLVYISLTLIVIVFAEPLIKLMAQDIALVESTVSYIRLEAIASLLSALVKFLLIALVTLGKNRYVFFSVLLDMFLVIILDVFLVSHLSFSFDIGVNGIALTNIIANAVLLIVIIGFFHREKMRIVSLRPMSFRWVKESFKRGTLHRIEALIRNITLMFVIVRMINIVGAQDVYWVANVFIWGWLMMPIVQLGELIEIDCIENGNAVIRDRILGYFVITLGIVALWFITMPLWTTFIENIMNVDKYDKVMQLISLMLGFYVVYAFGNVIDSTFMGLGKVDHLLYPSLIINIFLYGSAFILYLTNIYEPTLNKIEIMYGCGIILNKLIMIGIYLFMIKKRRFKDELEL